MVGVAGWRTGSDMYRLIRLIGWLVNECSALTQPPGQCTLASLAASYTAIPQGNSALLFMAKSICLLLRGFAVISSLQWGTQFVMSEY